MCDSVVYGLIEDTVNDYVNNQKTFSAFDVSLAVQRELKSRGLFDANCHRHQYLKSDVHKTLGAYVRNGLYKRELKDYSGYIAFEYAPLSPTTANTADPTANIADPTANIADPTANIADPTASNLHIIPQPTTNSTKEVGKPDSRGTLCIPSSYVKVVFKDSSLKVRVYNENGKLVVSQFDFNSAKPIAEYTIDSSNNVRITHSTLSNVYQNVDSNSRYDFSIEAGRIVVKLK